MAKKNRVGEKFTNNKGCTFIIVEYINANDLWVEFQDEYKARVHANYKNCRDGGIKNPYYPSVYGVGYLGLMSDGSRPKVGENGKDTREYKVWHSMIQRVYDPKFQEKNPTYKGSILEEELHCFAYFLEFVIRDIPNYEYWLTHPNEYVALDKDIRGNGSKIYSRDTIMFVPQSENTKERIERCGNSFGSQPIKVYGVNVKTGECTKVFDSIREASRETGAKECCISECFKVNGRQKTAHGYRWFKVE